MRYVAMRMDCEEKRYKYIEIGRNHAQLQLIDMSFDDFIVLSISQYVIFVTKAIFCGEYFIFLKIGIVFSF